MKTSKSRLLGLLVSSALTISGFAKANGPYHPLDALTTDEYWTVHDVVQQSGHWTDKTLVASLLLHEPAKAKVLTWKPGDDIPREADVILEAEGKTIEARIDIPARRLEFWKEVPGVQASITQTELDTMSDVVKRDPRVIAALRARGFTDLSTVRCEPIPLTFAAGTYVTRNKEIDGLPAWTQANRLIENADIVGWNTLGLHHVVRLEDWPIMPTLWHDFLIRPLNFFDKNPALTLPHQP